MPDYQRNAGFSLIELAIVVAIAGLITGTMAQQYRTWSAQKTSHNTGARSEIVSSAMTLFLTTYGRLPCPANPGTPPTAASSGYESCPANFGASPPALTACNGQTCRVAGRRDANPGGTMPDTDSDNDPVLIGTLPYAALGLSITDVVDGWNNKMTYAVSEYLTRANTFDENYGAIDFQRTERNESTGVVAPPASTTPGAGLPNSFMLAIISHGPDGKGAYKYQGTLNTPCGSIAVSRDNENCNNDARFLMANISTGVQNNSPGPAFFDDAFSIFTIRRDSDKWIVTGANEMQNKLSGKVGIGTRTPQTELDVAGNILLEDFRATEYCSPSGNCFTSSMIGGTIIDNNPTASAAHCGTLATPHLMRGVNGAATGKLDCVNTINTAGIIADSCDPEQYMTGIGPAGEILCAAP